MRVTKRQLKKIIAEESRRLKRLHEDSIDTELDNLKKNIGDDIEHIRDLKDDIKDDHEEELRAEKEKERKDESAGRRRLRMQVRRALVAESITDMRDIESMVDDFAVEVNDTFQMMMLQMAKEEPGLVESYKDWAEEVYDAGNALEEAIATSVRKTIETIETELHNGDFSRR